MRSLDADFNVAWLMFFGTKPPGIHPAGVFFTEAELAELAGEVPTFTDGHEGIDVEPYDPNVHNRRSLGGLYGSR